jgi:hypothetical protein
VGLERIQKGNMGGFEGEIEGESLVCEGYVKFVSM